MSCKQYKITQDSPTCFLLCTNRRFITSDHINREARPIYSLHQENFIVLIDFIKETMTFFKSSIFFNSTFWFSTMSIMKWNVCKYDSYSNDVQGSLLVILFFDYHNLNQQLVVQTQSMNTITTTKLPIYLHEWIPCIQPQQLIVQRSTASYSSN